MSTDDKNQCNAALHSERGHRYRRCPAPDAPWTHHHWPLMRWCDDHKPDGSRVAMRLVPAPQPRAEETGGGALPGFEGLVGRL